MSNEQQGQTLNDVLIERQSIRLGQMATQIESLQIQVEHLMNVLQQNNLNFDGTPIPQENSETSIPILNGDGEEVAVV